MLSTGFYNLIFRFPLAIYEQLIITTNFENGEKKIL